MAVATSLLREARISCQIFPWVRIGARHWFMARLSSFAGDLREPPDGTV